MNGFVQFNQGTEISRCRLVPLAISMGLGFVLHVSANAYTMLSFNSPRSLARSFWFVVVVRPSSYNEIRSDTPKISFSGEGRSRSQEECTACVAPLTRSVSRFGVVDVETSPRIAPKRVI